MPDYNLCRICLTEDTNIEDMHPIFEENMGILQKIQECSGILLKEHEEFPRLICQACVQALDEAHKFRLLCHASEHTLLNSIIKSECKAENENGTISLAIDQEHDEFYELRTEFINAEDIELTNIPDGAEQDEGEHFTDLDDTQCYQAITETTTDGEEHSEIEFLEDEEDDDDEDEDIIVDEPDKVETKKRVSKKIKVELSTRRRGRPKTTHKRKSLNGSSATPSKCNTKKGRKKGTDDSPTGNIMCEICGNIYTKQSLLNMHKRRHLADKPFDCEICGKTFACPSEIRRHMRVHTGEKPYVCKFCGRTFADRSTNIKHERIHTNERPFQCSTCGKSFTYSNVLKNHMLTHTGEKPFPCLACNKTFSRKHQLDQHCGTITHQQMVKNLSTDLVDLKMEDMDDAELIGAIAVVESTNVH